MAHLSDKQLLEKMKEFPDYELTSDQRNKVTMSIREKKVKNKKVNVYSRKVGAISALLAILILAPLLFLENIKGDNGHPSGISIEKAENGVYFALIDKEGKPIYADTNFGIPNKVSILSPIEWVAEDYRSVSKLMIFFWGNKQELVNKNLEVLAVHTETGFEQEMMNMNNKLSGSLHNDDAHTLTSFAPFPKAGMWNLKFMLEGKKYAEFSVYVKEPYVKVGESTILISKEDLLTGHYEDVSLDVIGSELPEKMKVELNSYKYGTKEVFTFKDKMDFIRSDKNQNASSYTGELNFKKSGKYRIKILNQSAIVEVREANQ